MKRALVVATVMLAACGREPHAMLAVQDPLGIATATESLAVGGELGDLRVEALAGELPALLLITSAVEGERLVRVEARAADGAVLARGIARARFAHADAPRTAVDLGYDCTTAGNDGRRCSLADGSGADGVCSRGQCDVAVCGDGYRDLGTEACDDGNDNPNDGCNACALTEWRSELLVGLADVGSFSSLPLVFPTALAADRGGNIVVVDSGADRVWRVTPDGVLTVLAGSGVRAYPNNDLPAASNSLIAPYGVASDGFGNTFISLPLANVVLSIDPAGLAHVFAGVLGTPGYDGDGGSATSAHLSFPTGLAVGPAGEICVCDTLNHRVRCVDGDGVIRTVAGSSGPDTGSFGGDGGPATLASLAFPTAIAVTTLGLVIADTNNHRLRLVDGSGTISTVAGTGIPSSSGDGGPSVAAGLIYPFALAATRTGDKVYLLEGVGWTFITAGIVTEQDSGSANHLRAITLSDGAINLVAGNAAPGDAGDDGPALGASFSRPSAIATEVNDAVLVMDRGNRRLRRIGVDGVIRAVTGPAVAVGEPPVPVLETALFPPAGLLVLGDAYLVTPEAQHIVLKAAAGVVSRIAGKPQTTASFSLGAFSGDGGAAIDAELAFPEGLAADGAGGFLIADTLNQRVRAVDAAGVMRTVAGGGAPPGNGDGGHALSARFSRLGAIARDAAGSLFVADEKTIRRVDPSGSIDTVAGLGADTGDGPASASRLGELSHLDALANDDIVFAERDTHRVRRLRLVSGTWTVSTLAGTGVAGHDPLEGAPAVSAALSEPTSLAHDSAGRIYVADFGNRRVRRIDLGDGTIVTVAGSGGTLSDGDGGPAVLAAIAEPKRIAIDANDRLVVSDQAPSSLRRVELDGSIATVVGPVRVGDGSFALARLGAPAGIAPAPGARQLLVSDAENGAFRLVDLERQTVSRVAGFLSGRDFRDAAVPGSLARRMPGLWGFVFDAPARQYYASEAAASQIVMLTPSADATTWTVSRFAGDTYTPGARGGPRLDARFISPAGLALDVETRKLYVADAQAHVVWSVDLASGLVELLAGTPTSAGFFGEGVAAELALFQAPSGVAVAPDHSLYVADTRNHRVRRLALDDQGRVSARSMVTTVIGDGSPGSSGTGAPARAFSIDSPSGMAVDGSGNLFVAARVAVRVVAAGDDGLAAGDDQVLTIYGVAPRTTFPESATLCLSGITLDVADEGIVYVSDGCLGYLLALRRQ